MLSGRIHDGFSTMLDIGLENTGVGVLGLPTMTRSLITLLPPSTKSMV